MKAPIVRHKVQLNINISPYLKNEIDELVEEKKEFSGYSDLCTIAITQFIERHKMKRAPGVNIDEDFAVPMWGAWPQQSLCELTSQ